MDIHEFIGYVHADYNAHLNQNEHTLKFELFYNDHYCRYFASHQSEWTLELADWMRQDYAGGSISIDNKKSGALKPESLHSLLIPEGVGAHSIEIQFVKNRE